MKLTRELPRYRCHKVVSALKITRVIPNPRGLELHPEDQRFAPIEVNENWVVRHKPASPGYLVIYEDGYASWSPASTFESGYTPLDPDLVVEEDTAKVRVESALVSFVRCLAKNRDVEVDPGLWQELLAYVPRHELSHRLTSIPGKDGRFTLTFDVTAEELAHLDAYMDELQKTQASQLPTETPTP